MQNQVDTQAFAPSATSPEATTLSQSEAQGEQAAQARKAFIEPTISAPADVLEATKFFAISNNSFGKRGTYPF